MTERPSPNFSDSRRAPDFRNGRSPTFTAITGGGSIPRTRLHSETIAVVSADEGSRFSQIELVPPKTQSCARNGVHQWGIVADNCLRQIDLWHNRDLTAVRFQIRIVNQFTRANTGAIDDHIKIARNFVHLTNMGGLDCATGGAEPVGQVIEVNCGIDKENS